jgi:hypothetical protein
MSIFEVDNENDLSMMIIKYEELYLKELTYYGTSDSNQIFLLISIGQSISKLENNIIENYYNLYINQTKINVYCPEIYYLHKILFNSFDIVLKMISLWVENKVECEEFEFKNRYLIGMLENYIEKFICPIIPNLQLIISNNKIFKIEHSLNNLKKFININKNKFTSKEKINQLEKFIRILN